MNIRQLVAEKALVIAKELVSARPQIVVSEEAEREWFDAEKFSSMFDAIFSTLYKYYSTQKNPLKEIGDKIKDTSE